MGLLGGESKKAKAEREAKEAAEVEEAKQAELRKATEAARAKREAEEKERKKNEAAQLAAEMKKRQDAKDARLSRATGSNDDEQGSSLSAEKAKARQSKVKRVGGGGFTSSADTDAINAKIEQKKKEAEEKKRREQEALAAEAAQRADDLKAEGQVGKAEWATAKGALHKALARGGGLAAIVAAGESDDQYAANPTYFADEKAEETKATVTVAQLGAARGAAKAADGVFLTNKEHTKLSKELASLKERNRKLEAANRKLIAKIPKGDRDPEDEEMAGGGGGGGGGGGIVGAARRASTQLFASAGKTLSGERKPVGGSRGDIFSGGDLSESSKPPPNGNIQRKGGAARRASARLANIVLGSTNTVRADV